MEDVLDLYEEEYDPRYPTVCFDEKLVAPEADVRQASAMEPGRPERSDYEYELLSHCQCVFLRRSAVRLAPCRNDGPPHQDRLRPLHPMVGR